MDLIIEQDENPERFRKIAIHEWETGRAGEMTIRAYKRYLLEKFDPRKDWIQEEYMQRRMKELLGSSMQLSKIEFRNFPPKC